MRRNSERRRGQRKNLLFIYVKGGYQGRWGREKSRPYGGEKHLNDGLPPRLSRDLGLSLPKCTKNKKKKI